MTNLRNKAEAILAASPEPERDLSPDEALRIIHELQVHQIELKLQNEELRSTWEELATAKARYADLYDRAPTGYVTLTPEGIVTEANSTLAELLGQDRATLPGQPLHQVIADKDGFYLHLRRVFAERSPQTAELPLALPGGREAWVELRSLCEPGQTHLCRTILIDVTRRKALERELAQARDAAEAASKAKSEFLANMSHELRTPLGGMLGMIALAIKENGQGEASVEYLQLAKQSGEGLIDIINDILDLSRIEAGRMQLLLAPFDIRAALRSSFKIFLASAQTKGLALTFDVSPRVPARLTGDQGRLIQVITNLVGNAVKYTKHGRIAARLDVLEGPEGDDPARVMVLFSVSDTGIGIPRDKLEAIFETFTQVDGSSTRYYGGAGLGLAISKQLVELMGGRIWVESSLDAGSTFFFTVPLDKPEAETPPAPAPLHSQASELPTLRVLLAEDEPINRLYLKVALTDMGQTVVAVTNGQNALDRLREERFDLVFLDVQMPVLNGIEVIRIIRQQPPPGVEPDTLVVALTAHALQGDRERLLEAGMDAYLSKPVSPEDLERMLLWAAGELASRQPRA